MGDDTRTLQRPQRSQVLIGLILVAVLLAVGMYAGLRSPWGTKHAQVTHGVALRANSDSDLVLFDADDGTQLTIYADSIPWASENQQGHGNPPCLREPLDETEVEVGLMRIAGPGGGWQEQAVWVRCL